MIQENHMYEQLICEHMNQADWTAAENLINLRSGQLNPNLQVGGRLLIHRAAEYWRCFLLQELLRYRALDVRARDKHGNTALHFAVQHGPSLSVELLMNACVEVSAQNHSGKEALDFAIAREQSDCEVLHQRKLRVKWLKRSLEQNHPELKQAKSNAEEALNLWQNSARILLQLLHNGAAIGRDIPNLPEITEGFHNCCFYQTTVEGVPLTHNMPGFSLAWIGDDLLLQSTARVNDIPTQQLLRRCEERLSQGASPKILKLQRALSFRTSVTLQKLCLEQLARLPDPERRESQLLAKVTTNILNPRHGNTRQVVEITLVLQELRHQAGQLPHHHRDAIICQQKILALKSITTVLRERNRTINHYRNIANEVTPWLLFLDLFLSAMFNLGPAMNSWKFWQFVIGTVCTFVVLGAVVGGIALWRHVRLLNNTPPQPQELENFRLELIADQQNERGIIDIPIPAEALTETDLAVLTRQHEDRLNQINEEILTFRRQLPNPILRQWRDPYPPRFFQRVFLPKEQPKAAAEPPREIRIAIEDEPRTTDLEEGIPLMEKSNSMVKMTKF